MHPTEIKYQRRGMNVFQKVSQSAFGVSGILYARPYVLFLDTTRIAFPIVTASDGRYTMPVMKLW